MSRRCFLNHWAFWNQTLYGGASSHLKKLHCHLHGQGHMWSKSDCFCRIFWTINDSLLAFEFVLFYGCDSDGEFGSWANTKERTLRFYFLFFNWVRIKTNCVLLYPPLQHDGVPSDWQAWLLQVQQGHAWQPEGVLRQHRAHRRVRRCCAEGRGRSRFLSPSLSSGMWVTWLWLSDCGQHSVFFSCCMGRGRCQHLCLHTCMRAQTHRELEGFFWGGMHKFCFIRVREVREVCVCEREGERDRVCVCVRERERVCERERERDGVWERKGDWFCVCVCAGSPLCVCVCVCVC